MRILLIEDDPQFRAVIERILEKSGHTLCWSGTGAGGVRMMYLEKVDAVFLDMNLGPEMSGWDVARIKQIDPELRKIPLVIISGSPPEELKTGFHGNPLANAVLVTKPVTLEEIRDLLDTLWPGATQDI